MTTQLQLINIIIHFWLLSNLAVVQCKPTKCTYLFFKLMLEFDFLLFLHVSNLMVSSSLRQFVQVVFVWHFTFPGPRILIYFYSKTNQIHQCLIYILFWNNSTCFGLNTSFPLASSHQYLFDRCLLLCVQSWNADDGRKDRPKHVECHSKIKWFDALVHLVGFTMEIHYDARPYEGQILTYLLHGAESFLSSQLVCS